MDAAAPAEPTLTVTELPVRTMPLVELDVVDTDKERFPREAAEQEVARFVMERPLIPVTVATMGSLPTPVGVVRDLRIRKGDTDIIAVLEADLQLTPDADRFVFLKNAKAAIAGRVNPSDIVTDENGVRTFTRFRIDGIGLTKNKVGRQAPAKGNRKRR